MMMSRQDAEHRLAVERREPRGEVEPVGEEPDERRVSAFGVPPVKRNSSAGPSR